MMTALAENPAAARSTSRMPDSGTRSAAADAASTAAPRKPKIKSVAAAVVWHAISVTIARAARFTAAGYHSGAAPRQDRQRARVLSSIERWETAPAGTSAAREGEALC